MITVTTFQTRRSRDIWFFLEHNGEMAALLNDLIVETSYLMEPPTFYVDLDGLRHVSIAKFANYPRLQAFLLELEERIPEFMNSRDSYNRVNNISTSRSITES